MSATKIGLREASNFLKTAGHTIVTQEATIRAQAEKIAAYELRDYAVAVAKEAEEKGLFANFDGVEKKAEHFLAHADKLGAIEQLVKHAGDETFSLNLEDVAGGGNNTSSADGMVSWFKHGKMPSET